jgi:hypothetical protein
MDITNLKRLTRTTTVSKLPAGIVTADEVFSSPAFYHVVINIVLETRKLLADRSINDSKKSSQKENFSNNLIVPLT